MALVTPQVRFAYGSLLPNLVPGSTLAEISQSELEDRLSQAHSVIAKAAGTTPGEQRAAAEQARRVLAARPREVVERLVAAKIAKAGVSDPLQAASLRDQARALLADEPPAVRRTAVVKAAQASGRVAVFDDHRRLLGTARASAVVQNVRKAAAAGDLQAVFDQSGNLIGVVDPAQIQPVASTAKPAAPAGQPAPPPRPGPAAQLAQPGQAAAVAKARAAARVPRLVPATDPRAGALLAAFREAATKSRAPGRTGQRRPT